MEVIILITEHCTVLHTLDTNCVATKNRFKIPVNYIEEQLP
jgi:hypothetical protein